MYKCLCDMPLHTMAKKFLLKFTASWSIFASVRRDTWHKLLQMCWNLMSWCHITMSMFPTVHVNVLTSRRSISNKLVCIMIFLAGCGVCWVHSNCHFSWSWGRFICNLWAASWEILCVSVIMLLPDVVASF